MPCGKWSIRRRYAEWLLRCRTWCASWINRLMDKKDCWIFGDIPLLAEEGNGLPRNYFMSGINTLKPDAGSTHKTKRIGRGPGSGHGKTAGRGSKGMWSRSGSSQKRGFEGGQMPLHRRLPKRGFTNARFKKEFSIVNVSDLVKFDKGSKIGPQEFLDAGLIRKLEKNGVRILGDGQLDRALHISAHYFTESARQKITSAGGTCEVIRL